ncbi:hypothetical protein BBJ28_00005226 [Nothophytophthora sp. Chile5]|nr:hypothetical protein BBJ28_00005226 [Nothophytophthora sp. Chile5]
MVSFVARKVVLALLLPIDDGGAPISKLIVYQNGTKVLSISSNRSIQVEVGPLRASSVYAFSVGAVSIEELGESNRSEAVLVITETASIPSVPYNFAVAQRTAYSLRFTWDGPDDTGGDDVIYEVSYQDNSSSGSSMTGLNVQELEVDYLTPSTSYLVRARAKNSAGFSGWTDGLSVETDVALRGIVIFQVLHPLVFENETSVAIQLVRVNGSSHTITCNYALNSTGTAISGKDFMLPPEAERTITFLEGEKLHEFVIQIVNNTVYDPVPRTIKLVLTDTTARTDVVLPSSTIITIEDDGDAGKIGFLNAAVNVSESARSLNLPLQRLGGSSSATSVRIVVFNGLPSTTQVETGFRLPSTEIGFVDGQVTGNASVVIKDNDAYDFPYLYFYLTLEMVSGGGQIGTNVVVRVTVQDDGDHSVPGLMATPVMTNTTGGMLVFKWAPPRGFFDFGGYLFEVDSSRPATVDAVVYLVSLRTFYEYSSQGAFDLQVTVEIGGLSPEEEYDFYYIPTNDVSACPGVNEHILLPVKFQTDLPSAPTPIQVIRQSGATGGGIHVEWDVPTDVGSDSVLFYQIYMSPSRLSTPVWTLMYNGTDTTYWQTKLTMVTEYLFKASCRNEVGYAANSSVSPLSTSSVSAPGPPGGLQYQNATGGMIQFSWDSPEDDGGSSITYYVVHGSDSNGEMVPSVEVETAEVFFGGLVANSEYEFKVYAGNVLGLGTDPGVAVFSTTKITAPSLPGEPQVLSSSGGSVTLAVPVPEDTGGVKIEDFACEVFANGVAIPLESIQRLQNAPETAAVSFDSRRLSTTPARRKLVTADVQFLYIKAGGLVPSVTYTFAIQVSNDVGQSDITGGAEGITSVASVPAIPDPPKVAGITGGALKLSWSDPVDTGGVPLTSYLLTLVGLDEEVGRCEGLVHSCTIGNLLSLTEYIVTLLASNAVGSSPPSEPVIYTTTVVSLPQAPQNPQIASTSNTFVTVEWEPCIDFGGAYVESYLMEVTQILNTSVMYQETVSVNQFNATISGLTPKMDYVVTVVRKAL